eukprot:585259_1
MLPQAINTCILCVCVRPRYHNDTNTLKLIIRVNDTSITCKVVMKQTHVINKTSSVLSAVTQPSKQRTKGTLFSCEYASLEPILNETYILYVVVLVEIGAMIECVAVLVGFVTNVT